MRSERRGATGRCLTLFAAIGCVFTFFLGGTHAAADQVTPSDRVVNHVSVRAEASSSSDLIGKLRPGEKAELLAIVGPWYKVKLPNEDIGFVSRAWTIRIAAPGAASAFKVHFLDVGTGDSAVIDIGEKEIIIDGGMFKKDLHSYVLDKGIIDGPIELVIVTHADSDHWKGLNYLLGFDEGNPSPPQVQEFWEPGYDRDCNQLASYDDFIGDIKSSPGIRFLRPLEEHHPPSVASGQNQPFQLDSIPGVTFTVLHTDATPESTNGDCAYLINNASIVLMVELSGFRFLFAGDANGKERDEPGPGTPGHIEAKLLALEQGHAGSLKADVLKVPHHGSETANTQAFIDAVDPRFAIISASTTHHLPRDTVVHRYEKPDRVILRTDEAPAKSVDHIICFANAQGVLDCNYQNVIVE